MSNDSHCFRGDHEVAREILRARDAAHRKHGHTEGGSMERMNFNRPAWLAILVEEVGEVARALTYDGKGDLRAELIDIAAVATAWIDSIDRSNSDR